MHPQVNSMNELNDYLDKLEYRINLLEVENSKLRSTAPAQPAVDGNMVTKYVSNALPRTNLLSPNFFKRAFTVWGHFFVAQLIIGVTFGVCYACLMATLLGPIFGNLFQNIQR
jgi:hypothetical protein